MGFYLLILSSGITTSTNSSLQFGWFRLKTEESSVLFESKLENV